MRTTAGGPPWCASAASERTLWARVTERACGPSKREPRGLQVDGRQHHSSLHRRAGVGTGDQHLLQAHGLHATCQQGQRLRHVHDRPLQAQFRLGAGTAPERRWRATAAPAGRARTPAWPVCRAARRRWSWPGLAQTPAPRPAGGPHRALAPLVGGQAARLAGLQSPARPGPPTRPARRRPGRGGRARPLERACALGGACGELAQAGHRWATRGPAGCASSGLLHNGVESGKLEREDARDGRRKALAGSPCANAV